MAQWTKQYTPPEQVNNGNQYEGGETPTQSDVTACFNDSFFAADKAAEAAASAQYAKQSAENSASSADTAQEHADNAATSAATAIQTANEAVQTAGEAVDTANQANDLSETANANAANALEKATDVESRADSGEFNGINGVVTPAQGFLGFQIEDGRLICYFSGDDAPSIGINESGHLIYSY